jgi:hypothetical protein
MKTNKVIKGLYVLSTDSFFSTVGFEAVNSLAWYLGEVESARATSERLIFFSAMILAVFVLRLISDEVIPGIVESLSWTVFTQDSQIKLQGLSHVRTESTFQNET